MPGVCSDYRHTFVEVAAPKLSALVAGKPEVRKYRVIYVVNDKETGDLSEEAVVTCQP